MLRAQAKQAMEARFRDLLVEAARLAQEYHADFGAVLKAPAPVTAFRYKASGKPAAKKSAPPAPAPAPKPKPLDSDPKIIELKKRLAQTRRKLEAAKASGKSTKTIDDQIYEIEDALRLAAQG